MGRGAGAAAPRWRGRRGTGGAWSAASNEAVVERRTVRHFAAAVSLPRIHWLAEIGRLAMTDDELKALVVRIAAAQERTDAQMAKTDAKLDRLAEMYGGVGNNQGAVAEEFYYNSLKGDPVLGGVRFDFVEKNRTRSHAGLEDEFDLLFVNGRTVFVVEVKYKAHEKDLRRLLEVKAPNFRRLFPEYADREHRFVLAAFHVHDDLKRAALEQGVTVLQRKGDLIETAAA